MANNTMRSTNDRLFGVIADSYKNVITVTDNAFRIRRRKKEFVKIKFTFNLFGNYFCHALILRCIKLIFVKNATKLIVFNVKISSKTFIGVKEELMTLFSLKIVLELMALMNLIEGSSVSP